MVLSGELSYGTKRRFGFTSLFGIQIVMRMALSVVLLFHYHNKSHYNEPWRRLLSLKDNERVGRSSRLMFRGRSWVVLEDVDTWLFSGGTEALDPGISAISDKQNHNPGEIFILQMTTQLMHCSETTLHLRICGCSSYAAIVFLLLRTGLIRSTAQHI